MVLMLITMMNSIVFANLAEKPMDKQESSYYTEEKTNIMVSANHPTFSIKLKSNPTTGFMWILREYDSNLITPVKRQFVQPTKKLIGAPGYEIWTFKAKPEALVVPQQTTIRLIYARPWQGSEGATQLVFHVTTQ